ncbi:hypothetical protein [Nocardia sp. AG03]|uniref:hypothetical protein n=1 Tax=Nocardia sp. AG03 TaxID=3025312 RepID=UPI0024182DF0|nr:hypothetical protein [Nocardia sp. AG03]
MKRHVWRARPDLVRDPRGLYVDIGDIMDDVVARITEEARPCRGSELDRFAAAHADARGFADSPEFRRRITDDGDPRVHRYWSLTTQLLGSRITVGRALQWINGALTAP